MKRIACWPRGLWRLFKLTTMILWSALIYLVDRRHRRDQASLALWLQTASRRCLKALNVQIDSRGEPARGAVIVPNHMGYLDILIVSALTPVVFVSKKEVRSWPVFGWFAEKAGTRFIDRSKRGDVSRISVEIAPVMAAKLNIVVFLEGTSTNGREVKPFKASLLEPAVEAGWWVVPVALSYAVPPGRSTEQEVCWWGDMTLAPHLLNFATLPWVRATVSWGAPVMAAGEDRKKLAETLHDEVVRQKALIEEGSSIK